MDRAQKRMEDMFIIYDELESLYFHDARILRFDRADHRISLLIDYAIATKENSTNEWHTDRYVSAMLLTLEMAQIHKIVLCASGKYDAQKRFIEETPETVIPKSNYAAVIASWIGGEIFGFRKSDEASAYYLTVIPKGSTDAYDASLTFSHSRAQWEQYLGKAWYEK